MVKGSLVARRCHFARSCARAAHSVKLLAYLPFSRSDTMAELKAGAKRSICRGGLLDPRVDVVVVGEIVVERAQETKRLGEADDPAAVEHKVRGAAVLARRVACWAVHGFRPWTFTPVSQRA
jgi:hypothetical protein